MICLLVGMFVYRKLKVHHIPLILMETVKSTGAVMIIIASAKVFGYYMTLERIPQLITLKVLWIWQIILISY